MPTHPLAGKPAPRSILVNVPRLVSAYYATKPDPAIDAQRVAFGTSGHRGSSLNAAFNEDHILAVTQALCNYRKKVGIDGPLFLGMDTHALSEPAFISAYEALLTQYGHKLKPAGDAFTSKAQIGAATAIEFGPRGRLTAVSEPVRRGGGSALVVRRSR